MDEYEFREGMDRLARIVETNREGERPSTERQPYACMCRMCGHRWNPRTDSVRPLPGEFQTVSQKGQVRRASFPFPLHVWHTRALLPGSGVNRDLQERQVRTAGDWSHSVDLHEGHILTSELDSR